MRAAAAVAAAIQYCMSEEISILILCHKMMI